MKKLPLRSWLIAFALAVPLGAAEDSLRNGDFESPVVSQDKDSETNPAEWTLFSSIVGGENVGLTAKQSHGGKQAARFTVQGKADAYQGLFQARPVNLGTTYLLTAHVRNDGASPLKGLARGQLSIEWKDSTGQEIERVWGPDWGASLSATQWSKFEMKARPPANASTAHFVITQFDGKGEVGSGGFLLDDVSVNKQQ